MSYSATAQTKFIDHCLDVFKNCAITIEPHEEQKFCCLLQIALREVDKLSTAELRKVMNCHKMIKGVVAYEDGTEWDDRNNVYRRTKTFTASKENETNEQVSD